jgi:hypothetical protein
MPRPSIEYLDARKAIKPASGGKIYRRKARYAEDEENIRIRRKRCAGCAVYWADPPSSLCPGCQTYREHQQ